MTQHITLEPWGLAADAPTMLAQIALQSHTPGWWAATIPIGIVAIYVFIKIEHIIVRLVCGFITLAVIAGAIWWFFLRH